MTHAEYQTKMSVARRRAERIASMRTDRAREACRLAGLDTQLLGIHPHNAMVSHDAGCPWGGVDYHYVRLCLHIQSTIFEGMRIYQRLHDRLIKQVTWGDSRSEGPDEVNHHEKISAKQQRGELSRIKIHDQEEADSCPSR